MNPSRLLHFPSFFAGKRRLAYLLAAWGLLIVCGSLALAKHSGTPGKPAQATHDWPANFPLARNPAGSTLLMTLHAKCPCSRASVAELQTLLAHADGKLLTYVLISNGDNSSPVGTSLWKSSSNIAGVQVIRDDAGALAARLGAETSGQTFVFDAGGKLVFQGGITASRGHIGNNAGRSAIQASLQQSTDVTSTPVFGCVLR